MSPPSTAPADPADPAAHYAAHARVLAARYDAALARAGFDAVLIGAGVAQLAFADDQERAFIPNPALLQWLPLEKHPGACLYYRPGEPPVAVVPRSDDYWHAPEPLPGAPWDATIEIVCVDSPARVAAALGPRPAAVALLGPDTHWDIAGIEGVRNPLALVAALDYDRAVKTDYELACIEHAIAAALPAHDAAAAAFRAGATEFDVLMAFSRVARQAPQEFPYPAIIAGDAHAATLHYQHYERTRSPSRSLLIDAGCRWLGYACDITRTHGAAGEGRFRDWIAALDNLQQDLCRAARPGTPFVELHRAAHLGIGGLLRDFGLVRGAPESMLETGITAAFFPHGLGHLLGLQVHDVGGRLAPDGGSLEAPPDFPRLRLLRTLEPGFVITIEPGLYFIPSLLRALRDSPLRREVDWTLVDAVRDCGGIRIEDDVRVGAAGPRVLSRPGAG